MSTGRAVVAYSCPSAAASADAYLAVAEETVKAAHDAVRTYLVETFRARKGATLRGLVTVSWVQDGASRALRPALEVDPAFLRQHGLTQLNPQSRGALRPWQACCPLRSCEPGLPMLRALMRCARRGRRQGEAAGGGEPDGQDRPQVRTGPEP